MLEKLQKLLEHEGYTVTAEVAEELERLAELLAEGGTADISGVLEWLEERKKNNTMKVTEIGIKDLAGWKTDPATGNIVHASGRFFQIVGVQIEGAEEREVSSWTQPMIKQNECGILGILTKKTGGVRHYLLSAKYEPGSIARHQLSPTMQATESNLNLVHGGKRPLFAEYFDGSGRGKVLLQVEGVEDPGRFYLKTNKCMIVEIPAEDLAVAPPGFIWLTLQQIRKLMKLDKVVNGFTRAILGSM